MPVFDADDALTVRQEGRNARATAGCLNFLFPESDKDTIAETYSRLVAQARAYFAPRWQSYHGANIDAAAFQDLLQEATLHWMYFYVINHLPVQISDPDWEHPQTRRLIQAVVARRFQPGSEEAVQLCAHLMGLSHDEYLEWREGDQWFLSIW